MIVGISEDGKVLMHKYKAKNKFISSDSFTKEKDFANAKYTVKVSSL